MVCGDSCLGTETLAPLECAGFVVVPCHNGQALIEEVVQHHPGAVIYGLGRDVTQDLGVLKLLRRADAGLPLILLASEGSLAVQRLVQSLRPTYYAVCPVDPVELREAVRAALNRPSH